MFLHFCSLRAHSVKYNTFFKTVANGLIGFLLKNTYIDTSVQKGGVPSIPGCIEVLTQLIQEAWESKVDLAVL